MIDDKQQMNQMRYLYILAEALTLRVMRQRLVLIGLTASITVHIIGDIIRKGLQQSIQHIHRFTG